MVERMTAAELHKLQGQKTGTKRVQGAERVTVDGQKFDSKREARRWNELKLLLKAGDISNLSRQYPIYLKGKDGPIMTDSGAQPRKYIADFHYYDHRAGVWIVEDAKGHATDIFNLKKAILAAQGIKVVLS